ncbi:NIF3-like protein 1 [Anneissia japonica]|uniref:NIF3-like protein 1 n=1 Tax=Anneissia japonica TaxID=1529436 RepID=UPI0014256069|nr:NIF3-like protein 1 [Anneissia japonica]
MRRAFIRIYRSYCMQLRPNLINNYSSEQRLSTSTSSMNMNLQECVNRLNKLASPSLAESWDNVGLLVEPTPPHTVSTLFMTNDLTEDVLEEAILRKSSMILSYHPPIFGALKRLTMASFKERIIVKAIENRIAVYSPHTAYDVVKDGLTDWLAAAPGSGDIEVFTATAKSREHCAAEDNHVDVRELDSSVAVKLKQDLASKCNIQTVQLYNQAATKQKPTSELLSMSFACQSASLASVVDVISQYNASKTTQITQLEKAAIPGAGMGRINTLHANRSTHDIINSTKKHLGVDFLSVAYGRGKNSESMVKKVAVCAGSGSSVLMSAPADLYITGEMSHHDILEINSQGISVILSNHSNSERAYLKILKKKLEMILEGKVDIIISKVDSDPLVTV